VALEAIDVEQSGLSVGERGRVGQERPGGGGEQQRPQHGFPLEKLACGRLVFMD
jgi:hypothetical protein